MRTLVFILASLLPGPLFAQHEHKFQFATIAGNEIAWSCRGSGSPTIALVAGGGLDAHNSFGRIYHGYDGAGRICMYDRAGMGNSTFPNPRTRTLQELVSELDAIREKAGWGPVLIVAPSFGGFIARSYAAAHPRETLGLLLIDVAHEDWLPILKIWMMPTDWAIMERIVEWNTRTFHEDYLEAQEAVRTTRMGADLPVTVLSRGIPHAMIRLERMSYEGIDIYEGEHNALQAQFQKLTNNTQRRVAKYSSHMFDNYDPWLVIEEIKLLVARLPN